MPSSHSDIESFYREVGPRLVRSMTLLAGNREEAEEIVQDALERLIPRWDRVRTLESPEGWLYSVAWNLARSRQRRARVRSRIRLLPASTDDQEFASTDRAIVLRDALARLPDSQRETLVARFFLDLSVAESAGLLGVAEGTIKAQTAKALKNLRAMGLLETFADGADDE